MKAKQIFASNTNTGITDAALLLVRIVLGSALVIHGWAKMQNPFHWMGVNSSFPSLLQFLASISEFGGGILLVLGLFTRLGGTGICCTMAVAVCKHLFVRGDPFVNISGGTSYELALIYFTLALLFIVNGPGRYSLDDWILQQLGNIKSTGRVKSK